MPQPDDGILQERASRLKERIYVTFAALAVTVTLASHTPVAASEAISTLLVTVLGTLLAVFTADVVSHLIVHQRLMTPGELRHAVAATFGALTAVALPLALLALAGVMRWDIESALHASAVVLLLALVVFGYLAARRVELAWWQRLAVLGGEALLGGVVMVLQLVAHG